MKDSGLLEIYLPILNFEKHYEISNYGNLRSIYREIIRSDGRISKYKSKKMKPRYDKDGYLIIGLNKNNKSYCFRVHRLVATAFISNLNNKPQVNHINGIKDDNRVENLEWVTGSENCFHAERFHLRNNGEDHINSKLTWKDVKIIRQIYNSKNNSSRKLAKIYMVDKSVILDVINYNTWKWEPEDET